MDLSDVRAEGQEALHQVLGYLNFASGASDAKFLTSLNQLYSILDQLAEHHRSPASDAGAGSPQAHWRVCGDLLLAELETLSAESSTFADSAQASAVLSLVLDHAIPGYRAFHQDLLFHQADNLLFGPFMFGRICEAVLSQGPPWNETDRIVPDAITALNDYIGHRPVAVLETRKLEPYRHERTRPIPLYIQGAGVAVSPYQALIARTLDWLEQTPEELLREAYFDLAHLDELAVDARAYDFEHPVNKRPNYHFGQWDPHAIDNRGYYRRFVVQQVTLDALMHRVQEARQGPPSQLLDEAAAVLGGTMLMAAGVSGSGPDTHDSTVTLTTLLPRIAAYRDRYYAELLDRFPTDHAQRLRDESARLHQPLGGARQALNTRLARCRASQIERAQLAKVFARMGHPEAARRQAESVHVASARMTCQIDCHLMLGQQAVESGNLAEAATRLEEIMGLLHRAIDCGAVVDPWNLLGFDGNFSLFPALENSVRDHRVDELLVLVNRIFDLYAKAWSESAAMNNQSLSSEISLRFEEAARWWHQFAAHEVQALEVPSALDLYQAARNVAEALNLWHQGGAAAGDVAFWAPHAEMFESPKSYALVVSTLLDRQDHVTSMALLMHWLSRVDQVPLERGDSSFHTLTRRWLCSLICPQNPDPPSGSGNDPEGRPTPAHGTDDPWLLLRKFFDYLEANAGTYWQVPDFGLTSSGARSGHRSADSEDRESEPAEGVEDEPEGLFSAAYQDVVYRDSTDDGVDGQLFDFEPDNGDELEHESERIVDRIAFLDNLAKLWKVAALVWPRDQPGERAGPSPNVQVRDHELFSHWRRQAEKNRRWLLRLMEAAGGYVVARPLGDRQSMIQYDRRRLMKETLLDQIIATCAHTVEAERYIDVVLRLQSRRSGGSRPETADLEGVMDEEQIAVSIFCHALDRDVDRVRQQCHDLFRSLRDKPILLVPIAKGGDPREIVTAQIRQHLIETLLVWLPRLGLLTETRELIDLARDMERNVPVGPGAVTQFDELYEMGYRAMVEMVVRAAAADDHPTDAGRPLPKRRGNRRSQAESAIETELVNCLEQLTESLLVIWLEHSRTLRLSVLEKVGGKENWERIVTFIQRYGADIFTQRFLNLGNLRAILHQGVEAWLFQLEDQVGEGGDWRLVEDLGERLSHKEASENLAVILEALVENYAEYRDYNCTTTQSDRGDMLYSLLDFLRLRVAYDRVVWNLKPVILSHEILVKRGRSEAAQLWRRALNERISDEADRYLERLAKLQEKYAMRMASVADRLGERFLRTMAIDRMRALVEPAMCAREKKRAEDAFEILKEETALLMRDPTGAGLEAPPWLVALEEEVERIRRATPDADENAQLDVILPPEPMGLEEIQEQLEDWA